MPNDTSRPTMVLSLDVEAFYRVVEDGFYDVGGKRQRRYSMRPQGGIGHFFGILGLTTGGGRCKIVP